MCVVSMVGDHYTDKWRDLLPGYPSRGWPVPNGDGTVIPSINVSREEFDQLKRDVEEMKTLLKRAKEYDERNGEPDCEIDEKMEMLRRVAKMVGVDIEDVIGAKPVA